MLLVQSATMEEPIALAKNQGLVLRSEAMTEIKHWLKENGPYLIALLTLPVLIYLTPQILDFLVFLLNMGPRISFACIPCGGFKP